VALLVPTVIVRLLEPEVTDDGSRLSTNGVDGIVTVRLGSILTSVLIFSDAVAPPPH